LAYAASVAPNGSAWDRACELYAQLSGTRVDYGKAHTAVAEKRVILEGRGGFSFGKTRNKQRGR